MVPFLRCFLFPVPSTRSYIMLLTPAVNSKHLSSSRSIPLPSSNYHRLGLRSAVEAMAALASASTLFCGAALSVSAPAGSSRRVRTGVRAEAETSTFAAPINPSIRKETDKVVDTVQVSELSKPLVAYCRCWRSETFPLCNGAHVKHNKETGDNVGPLLLKK